MKVCLCAHITPLHHHLPVQILIHPSELNAAKGTAKLTEKVLDHCQLWPGESADDLAPLRQHLADVPAFLLYPDEQAQPVETATLPPHSQLLVLDGTWRKTHKILQLNPWLQALPKLSFHTAPQGNYQIRKAHREDSLSTLEAIAYALEQLEGCDPSPLYHAFEALKQSQLAHMPAEVRTRYR
ncbi:tRNA-uridine aminocarboxypropyltransferase [Ferrimonas pelagia]|uniref:tRNA-uridine aminocarboxypropyltransferase n=2 Tax=Ferrimonas pelagia TaxID=1177826 RepID=A0ABP9F5F2_9GAMM